MKKKTYELPVVEITRMNMEKSIADLVRVSAAVYIEQDWEEGGVIGTDTSVEGGDIYLY